MAASSAAAMIRRYGDVSAMRTPATRSRKPPHSATTMARKIRKKQKRSTPRAQRGGTTCFCAGSVASGDEGRDMLLRSGRDLPAPEYSIQRAVLDPHAHQHQRDEEQRAEDAHHRRVGHDGRTSEFSGDA